MKTDKGNEKGVIARPVPSTARELDEAISKHGNAPPLARSESLIGLPRGWVWTRLGQLISFEYGKGLRKDKRQSDGEVPVYGSNGLVGYHSVPLTRKPCLIVGRKGSIGSVHLAKVPCWPIDTTYFIESPEGTDLFFLFHLVSSLRLGSMDKSTAIPGLNRDDAYALEIPLPPLPEQRRIVAKIEELFTRLDAGVEALNKTKAQLKRYRQAVLRDAFQGKLTQEWREAHKGEVEPTSALLQRIKEQRRENAKAKYKELLPLDAPDLPQLPEGWVWATVGEIALVASGQTPKHLASHSSVGEIPYFKVGDMNRSGNEKYMFHSDITLNPVAIDRLGLHIQNRGTIVFPKRGGAISTNKKRILAQPSVYDLNIMGVYPLIMPHEFFYYWILSIDLATLSDGSNVPQINHMDVEPLVFPIPPIAEQHRIVEEIERRLSVAEEIEKTVDQSLKQAGRLRQSVLKTAFEGKLVPQDPSDEPAEKLLERIREEREQWQQAEREITKQGRRNTNMKQMGLI